MVRVVLGTNQLYFYLYVLLYFLIFAKLTEKRTNGCLGGIFSGYLVLGIVLGIFNILLTRAEVCDTHTNYIMIAYAGSITMLVTATGTLIAAIVIASKYMNESPTRGT